MAGGARADPDLDRAGWKQRQARFGDPKPPGGIYRFARQQAPDNVESFLESRRARPDVGAHRGEPSLAPAEPALHDEGALSDGGERTDLLSHQHRVPQGEQKEASGRSLAPFGEKPPEHRRVLIIQRRRHVLIADEQGIEPGAVSRRGSLDHPARSLARILHVGVIARERDPNPHRVILVAGSGFDQTRARNPNLQKNRVAEPKSPAPRPLAVASRTDHAGARIGNSCDDHG